jgi:hypothetical protein
MRSSFIRRKSVWIALAIVITWGALALASHQRYGVWFLGGVAAHVFEPHATTFSNEGVLVCAPPFVGGRRAGVPELTYLQISPEMRIYDRRGTLFPKPATFADLRRGQRVRLWEKGMPSFSYPSQIRATQLIIEADSDPALLSCGWGVRDE